MFFRWTEVDVLATKLAQEAFANAPRDTRLTFQRYLEDAYVKVFMDRAGKAT